MASNKTIVLSDLHFGDPSSSLRHPRVHAGLLDFLQHQGRIDKIVLAGDILDANINSLTRAIEGFDGNLGFRAWLRSVAALDACATTEFVYVPGNHDYIIWNLLSTQTAFMDALERGETLGKGPLMAQYYPAPFLRGVAPPSHRARFHVDYPDHVIDVNGKKTVITHGHYLDRSQTLFAELDRLIREEGDVQKAVRRYFILTAQYQAVANAVSYSKNTSKFIDDAHKAIAEAIEVLGFLRGKPIDDDLVASIRMYLGVFRGMDQLDVFVFGHTHRAARANARNFGRKPHDQGFPSGFDIFNTGCFLDGPKRQGSFLLIDESSTDPFRLMSVSSSGEVTDLKP